MCQICTDTSHKACDCPEWGIDLAAPQSEDDDTSGDDSLDEEDAEGSPEIEMASDTEEPAPQTQGSQSSPDLFPATPASHNQSKI